MRDLKNISSELFDKIRARFDNVRLGDEKSKATTDPEQARFFNFDYTVDGHKVGNITISLIDDESLKLYYGRDIVEAIKEFDAETGGETTDGVSNEQKWYNFLRSVRQFAKRNLLTFDTRDITKSNLQIKDVKQQAKADDTLSTDEMNVTESKMFGTRRSSYQECGPVRLIVRHQGDVNDEVRGARSRHIDSIFLETHVGERFLCPSKSLHIARALAQHLSQGGEMHDEVGGRILLIGEEMESMRHFVREVKRRQFEDKETDAMARAAVRRYDELKGQLKHLAGRRGYDDYKNNYHESEYLDDSDVDVDALRERFVKKVYNDKFDAALPFVYKAYMKQKQEGLESPLGNQFEDWANEVVEGTWHLPNDQQDVTSLDDLMAQPLEAGENGENAKGALYDIIGDDALFDKLTDVASAEGPETDARPTIIAWLRDNSYTELADKYDTAFTQDDTGLKQQSDAVAAQQSMANQTGSPGTAEPSPAQRPEMQESTDLGWLRKLSGLN
jgi:hypothetical protein